MRGIGFGALVAGVSMVGVAEAAIVDSVHVGVLAHNIQVIDGKNANKEDGPVVEAELTFAAPGVFRYLLSPKPYAVVSANVAGDTSFAGVGLNWRWEFLPGWSLDPGLGYVVHDGELDLPFPAGDPRNTEFNEENVLYGSRDLFRTTLGLSREVGEKLSAQVFYNHLSHGQILGEGRNQGVDQLGVRIGYRFGE